MTQQFSPPMGQQQQQQPMGGQQMQTTPQAGGGQLPQQLRPALHSVAQAVQVCGWCADQCIQMADPHMIECIRLCEDVVELGETVLATVPRQSRFSSDIVMTFQQAAQECAMECGQHAESHCQECASVLDQAVADSQQLSTTASGQSGGMNQNQQMGGTGTQHLSM